MTAYFTTLAISGASIALLSIIYLELRILS